MTRVVGRRRRPRRAHRRARLRRRRPRGHAAREAGAARRRDVLGRARRPLARQRPARLPALLHRLPWLPRPHRCGGRRRAPGPPRRAGRRARRADAAAAPLAACRRRCTSAPRSLRYPSSPRSTSPARPAPSSRCGASDSTTRRSTRETFGAWLARARPVPGRDRGALGSDRAADAQRARRPRPRSRSPRMVFQRRPARAGRRRRHRLRHRAAAAPPRRSRAATRSARPASRCGCGAGVTRRRRGRELGDGRGRGRGDRGRRRHRRRAARGGRRARRRAPPGGRRPGARSARVADREPPRRATTGRCCDVPFAAGIDSPVQWVFDRTDSSGLARGAAPRRLAVGRRTTSRRAPSTSCARGSSRRSPSSSRPRATARVDVVLRHPRARARPSGARPGRPRHRPRHATRDPGLFLAGAWTDTGWPATMEGAVRSGSAAARARLGDGASERTSENGGMSGLLEQTTLRRQARVGASSAVDHLLSLQNPDGWWKGELETNVTMDAEDLLLREFLGIRTRRDHRGRPRAGSGRSSATTAPGRTSTAARPTSPTTVEAYVALRLAGDPADAAAHAAARRSSSATRGGARARPGVHPDLARAVRRSGRGTTLPAMPPELIFLPPWFPLNIYDFACWARQTIVPLTVVSRATGRCAPLPFAIDELRAGAPPPPRGAITRPWGRALPAARPRAAPLRAPPDRGALRRAALRARRSAGSSTARRPTAGWGGIQPPWVYSLIALHLLGLPARPSGDRRRRSRGLERLHDRRRTARPARSRPASRRCGTPRSR